MAVVRGRIRRQVEFAIVASGEAETFAEEVRHCKSAYNFEEVVKRQRKLNIGATVLPVSVRKSVEWLEAVGSDRQETRWKRSIGLVSLWRWLNLLLERWIGPLMLGFRYQERHSEANYAEDHS